MKSEERIQQEIYREFNNEYPHLRGCLFHVPNGGSRSGREAAKFKTMGVYPGVSDLIFLFDGVCYLIELKDYKGTQSEAQIEWETTMRGQGFEYVLFRTKDDTMNYINGIIENKTK